MHWETRLTQGNLSVENFTTRPRVLGHALALESLFTTEKIWDAEQMKMSLNAGEGKPILRYIYQHQIHQQHHHHDRRLGLVSISTLSFNFRREAFACRRKEGWEKKIAQKQWLSVASFLTLRLLFTKCIDYKGTGNISLPNV